MILVALTVVSTTVPGALVTTKSAPVPMEKLVSSGFLGKDGSTAGMGGFSIYDYIHSYNTGLTQTEERELASLIYFESMKYGYDPAFILAIIQTESAFKHDAVSNVGARGLMQLMPTTGREIAYEVNLPWQGNDTLNSPDVNVRMGMYYLFEMLLRYKDLRLALVAYNCGPGFVDQMQKLGYKLPDDYVNRVMGNYERIKTQGM